MFITPGKWETVIEFISQQFASSSEKQNGYCKSLINSLRSTKTQRIANATALSAIKPLGIDPWSKGIEVRQRIRIFRLLLVLHVQFCKDSRTTMDAQAKRFGANQVKGENN